LAGALLLTLLLTAVVVFLITLFFVKILWAWTIPDLFPGAVSEGLIAGSISWLTTFKVALLVAALSMFAHMFVGRRCCWGR